MASNARRFAFYVAIGATVVMILFPPFSISTWGGSATEYGFIFTGPSGVGQAMGAAGAIGGKQGQDMMRDMVHYSPDFVRLLIQLVVVWATYLAAAKTVLRPTTRPMNGQAG